MSIYMVKTIKEEKLIWILPVVRRETRLVDTARVCPHSKRSLERWLARYKSEGETGLEPRSTEPKTLATKERRNIDSRKNNRKDFEKRGSSTKVSSQEN